MLQLLLIFNHLPLQDAASSAVGLAAPSEVQAPQEIAIKQPAPVKALLLIGWAINKAWNAPPPQPGKLQKGTKLC